MKRWALLVALLYGLILVALTIPATMAAFAPDASFAEVTRVFNYWPYWLWLAVMILSQAALLLVPVAPAIGRPTSRRRLYTNPQYRKQRERFEHPWRARPGDARRRKTPEPR